MKVFKLENNVEIIINKSEEKQNEILFKVINESNRYFETSCDFSDLQDIFNQKDISEEQFIEYLQKNHFSIKKGNNGNEIILNINADKNFILILKEVNSFNKTVKNETPGNDGEDEAPPPIIIENKIDIIPSLKFPINDKDLITINQSVLIQKQFIIMYMDNYTNQIYKTSYVPENEIFYKALKENKPLISIEERNDNEIKLKITYLNEKLFIILKKLILMDKNDLENWKKYYKDKIKDLKYLNEELKNKNQKLLKEIDEEKDN